MTGKTMERLRSLLKTYDERTAKPQTDFKTVDSEGERRRRVCGDRLQNVVRPVLQGFADELQNAGHEAAIRDHTNSSDAYPSVALTFTPRSAGGTALASVLTFRYDPRRGIAVGRDIKPSSTRGRAVTSSTDRIGTIRVETVSADWVETKTLSFIETVLKVN
ncbi:MAG: hypothetical protein AUH81_10550 [Candidatus Rokubacteria bacterium 13_1_40CM_4_69_5]|nr:MAG: hypothetical protein AUH81_10550 [Candidatus Rokubacteria bacterium 13_1_40CM_4_69_5]